MAASSAIDPGAAAAMTQAFAVAIFVATYAVVAVGRVPGWRIDRAGAAFLGAALMVDRKSGE